MTGSPNPKSSLLDLINQYHWQRRFWEKIIHHDKLFANHLNYIHYNPVKHGLAQCPTNGNIPASTNGAKMGVIPTIGNVDATPLGGWA